MHEDWRQIKQLYLSSCNINDDNVDILLNLEWPNLAQLTLTENKLTDRSEEDNLEVVEITHLINVRYTISHIARNCINQNGLKILLS